MQNDFFEWDDDKADANYRKHGVSFDEACTAISDDFAITHTDDRENYGEQRLLSIGMSENGRILNVIWTPRNDKIRVISAFVASATRRKQYENQPKLRHRNR
ncbi:MAG: BrnT family toxin [Neisseriaceae bacterium]|nr:BrnT family toxin [Neisseriaceae bacterium]